MGRTLERNQAYLGMDLGTTLDTGGDEPATDATAPYPRNDIPVMTSPRLALGLGGGCADLGTALPSGRVCTDQQQAGDGSVHTSGNGYTASGTGCRVAGTTWPPCHTPATPSAWCSVSVADSVLDRAPYGPGNLRYSLALC